MIKLNVCANCKNLKKEIIMGDFPTYSCKPTGFIIPHYARKKGDKILVTFWRIPISCPLPSSEVTKSLEKAPESEWITI